MPASSQFLGKIRQSYTSSGGVMSTNLPGLSPSVMVASDPTIQQSLDVLDEVLNEVEAQAAQSVSTMSVSPDPVTPDPVVADPAAVDPVVADPAAADSVDSDASSSMASAVPLAVAQATNTLNPQTLTLSAKEIAAPVPVAEVAAPVDLGGGYQMVEVEPNAELSPEVSGFLQEVRDNVDQQPQEVVIADGSMQLMPPAPAMRKVVVLPITPELEKKGARQSPKNSVRWLIEWSRRLMKMFSGKIVYAEESS